MFNMAWRNLWRNPRRTIVTLTAMTLALLVMILYTSIVEGFLRDLEKDIVEVEVGDIQVHGEGYREAPSLYTTIDRSEALIEALEEHGYRVSARRLGGGLIASGDSSAGAQLIGIDIERDRTVSRVSSEVENGEWIDESDPAGVVLGHRLARTLDVDIGDELIVLSQAADGSMANDLYSVRGILRSVSEATDRAGLFMTQAAFEELFAFDRGAHQMVLRKPDQMTAEAALEEVRTLVGSISRSTETKSWRELLPTMATMVDSTRGAITMVFVIIYLAIAILILNAMLMAVFERLKELGVLKAIGMQPARVLQLMLTEAGIQAACATGLGVLLSIPGLIFLTSKGIDMGALGGTSMAGMTMDTVWYAAVTPLTFAGPVGVLLVLVFLAVLYPGIKAARISPIDAMRHQ